MLKPMVCNKTNFKTIAGILGAESDDWAGGEIVLTSAMVEFGGDIVPGLRVRAPRERIQGNGGIPSGPASPLNKNPPNPTTGHIPKASPDFDPADDEIPF